MKIIAGGKKIIVINGEKAIANERDNSLTSMIANKVMVKIDGGKQVKPEVLKEYSVCFF